MLPEDALPQRLLVLLTATPEGLQRALAAAPALRDAAIPTLVVSPLAEASGQIAPADLGRSRRRWRRATWLERLHPDGVLACDDHPLSRAGVLAARASRVPCWLALPLGQRVPWRLRLARVRTAPQALLEPECVAHRLVPWLRAELLGTAAGVARLALSPLAVAGQLALDVKRS